MILPTGEEIPYSIDERDIQNSRLTLRPDGTLDVIVPFEAPANTLVTNNRGWIVSEYDAQQSELAAVLNEYHLTIDDFILWGRPYELRTKIGEHDIELTNDEVVVTTPSDESPWTYLEKEVRQALTTAIESFAADFCRRLDCEYETLSIRSQRSKWASCSGGDTLNFNLRCAFLPLPHLRYLVAHEIAHLIESSHSQQFWRLVEMLDSGYQSRKDELQGFWYAVHHNTEWRRLLGMPDK